MKYFCQGICKEVHDTYFHSAANQDIKRQKQIVCVFNFRRFTTNHPWSTTQPSLPNDRRKYITQVKKKPVQNFCGSPLIGLRN